ncbi:hypothetical protein CHS0354_005373 [Potamilus streckersoni]|uniref:Uncharacterized protein n=1 Tax=Potamilus streckersoni TaxID=2493646 RepID=A0AAE0SJ99_9BIVA|nr:hypothetical protein CHS0354_005373 [Potamilus streckersoni]
MRAAGRQGGSGPANLQRRQGGSGPANLQRRQGGSGPANLQTSCDKKRNNRK